MNKAPLHKHVKFVAKKSAKRMGVLQAVRSISREKYTEKVSASLLYGLLSSIAVNFFFQPGHVYSSGATGLAQVLSALSVRTLGFEIPVSLTFYAINIPLLILAWYKIGHKFTIFTFITVTMSSLFIQVMPHVTLTEDPLINAIFGGLVMGTGIGFGLKSRISSGGTDIIAKIINKRFGIAIGKILLTIDFIILSMVAFIFGKIIFMYTLISLLVSAKMVDVIQEGIYSAKGVTIITNKAEELRKKIMEDTGRGLTLINAKGAYTQKEIGMLYCVVGKYQLMKVKSIVKEIDPEAFMIVNQVHEVVGKGFLGQ